MNWMQQFKQRVEQGRQPEKMPRAKEVSEPRSIQVNSDIPASVPTAQGKAPEKIQAPIAGLKREKLRIYCFKCQCTAEHAEMPCDLEQYRIGWMMYVCGICGLNAYARKDAKKKCIAQRSRNRLPIIT